MHIAETSWIFDVLILGLICNMFWLSSLNSFSFSVVTHIFKTIFVVLKSSRRNKKRMEVKGMERIRKKYSLGFWNAIYIFWASSKFYEGTLSSSFYIHFILICWWSFLVAFLQMQTTLSLKGLSFQTCKDSPVSKCTCCTSVRIRVPISAPKKGSCERLCTCLSTLSTLQQR